MMLLTYHYLQQTIPPDIWQQLPVAALLIAFVIYITERGLTQMANQRKEFLDSLNSARLVYLKSLADEHNEHISAIKDCRDALKAMTSEISELSRRRK